MKYEQTNAKGQKETLLGVMCICVIFTMFLCAMFSKQVYAESVDSITEVSYGFLDYQMFDEYWTNGVYRCGSDFEPGDYYILSLFGAEACYAVSDDPYNFAWSSRVLCKVSVSDGQYVHISHGGILVPEDEIDTNDWKKYGVYLIGTDLPEGDYKMASITDEYNTDLINVGGVCGAYQISESSPESEPVYCSELYESQAYISVESGQYLIINNAEMTLVGAKTSSTSDAESSKTESTTTTETTSKKDTEKSTNTAGSVSSKEDSSDEAKYAKVCAVKAVKDNLKAPSTAEFCSYSEMTATHLGGNNWKVSGYVDAENSFGAMMHENWTVILTLTDSGFTNPLVAFG